MTSKDPRQAVQNIAMRLDIAKNLNSAVYTALSDALAEFRAADYEGMPDDIRMAFQEAANLREQVFVISGGLNTAAMRAEIAKDTVRNA